MGVGVPKVPMIILSAIAAVAVTPAKSMAVIVASIVRLTVILVLPCVDLVV